MTDLFYIWKNINKSNKDLTDKTNKWSQKEKLRNENKLSLLETNGKI